MSRAAAVLVALVGVCLLLTTCHGLRAIETESENFTFAVGARPPLVEVRVERGRLEVTPSRSGKVEIEVRKTARGYDRDGARALLDAVGLEVRELDEGLRIESRARGSGTEAVGGSVETEFRLRVPPSSDLDLRTGDGPVRVDGIGGSIAVDSGDGRLELEAISGRIRLRTADGSITGRDLDGSVDARTDDGRIELDGRFDRLDAATGDGSIRVRAVGGERALEESWTLRSQDGSIRLELPPGLSADIEASTRDGAIEIDLPDFSGSRNEHRARGRVGEGGAVILVLTMDGAIHLEEG